jgi:hypothetical protein
MPCPTMNGFGARSRLGGWYGIPTFPATLLHLPMARQFSRGHTALKAPDPEIPS